VRALALTLALVSAIALGSLARGDDAPPEKVPLPKATDFAKLVLEVARAYPTDGTHGYYWPKGGSWPGTTMDLFYMGKKVCEGDAKKRCFCCGITFEVFFRAYENYCAKAKKPFRILDLDPEGIGRLRHEWFGPTEKDRTTLQKAIVTFKLGKAVPLEDARPGDFCQLWRHSGNGHSVIVVALEKDAAGKPASLRYWSTQSSTNGISEHVEKFSDEKKGVIAAETYVARVGDEG
jgi:hypothetical protein